MPLMWLGWPVGTTGTVVAAAVVAGGVVVAVVVRLRAARADAARPPVGPMAGHRKEVAS
ncbi:MAG TPA: hypothetical protein VMV06_02960 [Acidimicrobiales bacterium]|nr:hypothetical protein [Acidimicrobiales bacterium]